VRSVAAALIFGRAWASDRSSLEWVASEGITPPVISAIIAQRVARAVGKCGVGPIGEGVDSPLGRRVTRARIAGGARGNWDALAGDTTRLARWAGFARRLVVRLAEKARKRVWHDGRASLRSNGARDCGGHCQRERAAGDLRGQRAHQNAPCKLTVPPPPMGLAVSVGDIVAQTGVVRGRARKK